MLELKGPLANLLILVELLDLTFAKGTRGNGVANVKSAPLACGEHLAEQRSRPEPQLRSLLRRGFFADEYIPVVMPFVPAGQPQSIWLLPGYDFREALPSCPHDCESGIKYLLVHIKALGTFA